jgi:hypothetical protein
MEKRNRYLTNLNHLVLFPFIALVMSRKADTKNHLPV